MTRRAISVPLLLATVYCISARGQAPAATLYVELQNVVEYQVDTSDLSKYGTDPNVTPGKIAKGLGVGCAGVPIIGYGDIVAVNGQPARGTYAVRGMAVCLTPNPVPGVNGSNAISDTTWNSVRDETYEILQSDGITPVGTIMTYGLSSVGPSPPGPPAGRRNSAITGGTGAFLGARGQRGQSSLSGNVPERTASITEDPAKRRQNGGGHLLTVLYVIPMSWPTVVTTAGGPAIVHSSDFSLVSASKPAVAGEILSLFATGLGPTRTSLTPGQAFPSTPLAVVNSPIDVTVNGKSAEVLGAVGYPGAVDGYQVNFRIPPETGAGTATIQISSAWIPGAPVSIAMK
ncbi:MAG: hypothetical protein JJE04_00980 [Acidobacteriia bacterium]|nr:hypothetical protein [Terriglobia bacterium]